MEKVKICAVVTGLTIDKFLDNLKRIQRVSDMVELRLDQIDGLTKEDVALIRQKTKKESIATCRNMETLLHILGMGFDHIDVDTGIIDKSMVKVLKNVQEKLIVSYHDFEKTDSEEKLLNIYEQIKKMNPDVIKIATMVTGDVDNMTLIKLMVHLPNIPSKIVIGMGEKGKATRILGALMGNYLTYASTRHGQTARGQIDILKLKRIYKLLD